MLTRLVYLSTGKGCPRVAPLTRIVMLIFAEAVPDELASAGFACRWRKSRRSATPRRALALA